jgi:ABC-type bacteriocin/lantibiotic exporter with double-glycine peptidase domain
MAGTDPSGTTMLGLKQAAEALGLKAVGMRLSLGDLAESIAQGKAVIAFVGGDHYVWVREVGENSVVFSDDTPGEQTLSADQWLLLWEKPIPHQLGLGPSAASFTQARGQGLCLVLSR